MYVIQMPELTCALWFKPANGYGSFVGFIVGLLLRALAGEPILKFPAVIKYPGYDDELKISNRLSNFLSRNNLFVKRETPIIHAKQHNIANVL
jgi:hypothetical protein